MRITSLFFFLLFLGFSYSNAQTSSNNRVSPLSSVQLKIDDVNIEIIYSRPFLKGREFGKDIVPFGKLWRTGANEATTFETNQDIIIEDKPLKAGKYSLYSIPDAKETIVIFNKEWDQWGTQYNEDQDVIRVTVPTFTSEEPTEQFTIDLDETGSVCLTWGKTLFAFTINTEE